MVGIGPTKLYENYKIKLRESVKENRKAKRNYEEYWQIILSRIVRVFIRMLIANGEQKLK